VAACMSTTVPCRTASAEGRITTHDQPPRRAHSTPPRSEHLKLLASEAKEVLASLGIPIPPGMVARTPDEAVAAFSKLGPVAVKAQVPVGGRGKAGGIRLAQTADEARSAAAQIIGMDIKGFKVPLVYC